MIKVPLKVFEYVIKKNHASVDWAHPFVQDNLDLIYTVVKEIVKPF